MNDNFSAFTLCITVLSAVTLSSAARFYNAGGKVEKILFIPQKKVEKSEQSYLQLPPHTVVEPFIPLRPLSSK